MLSLGSVLNSSLLMSLPPTATPDQSTQIPVFLMAARRCCCWARLLAASVGHDASAGAKVSIAKTIMRSACLETGTFAVHAPRITAFPRLGGARSACHFRYQGKWHTEDGWRPPKDLSGGAIAGDDRRQGQAWSQLFACGRRSVSKRKSRKQGRLCTSGPAR